LERIKKNKQEVLQKYSQSQRSHIHPLIKIIGEPHQPKCFEACAGCGDMTIGFTKAGFDVQWAVKTTNQ